MKSRNSGNVDEFTYIIDFSNTSFLFSDDNDDYSSSDVFGEVAEKFNSYHNEKLKEIFDADNTETSM